MQSNTIEELEIDDRHEDHPRPPVALPHPAETDARIHPVLRHRWSPRKFADRSVDDETLRSLLEAARWAPSAYNEQPWRFVVATDRDPEAHDKLAHMLVEGNRAWAADAPVLMISFAHQKFAIDGRDNAVAKHDVGQAVAQMTVEAVSRGILVHQMSGIHHERIVESYDLPDEIVPVAAIALGYPPEPDDLTAAEREEELTERSRKPLDEIVYDGEWA